MRLRKRGYGGRGRHECPGGSALRGRYCGSGGSAQHLSHRFAAGAGSRFHTSGRFPAGKQRPVIPRQGGAGAAAAARKRVLGRLWDRDRSGGRGRGCFSAGGVPRAPDCGRRRNKSGGAQYKCIENSARPGHSYSIRGKWRGSSERPFRTFSPGGGNARRNFPAGIAWCLF